MQIWTIVGVNWIGQIFINCDGYVLIAVSESSTKIILCMMSLDMVSSILGGEGTQIYSLQRLNIMCIILIFNI